MQEIIIRKAAPGDIEYLLQFEQGVIEAERVLDDTIQRGKVNYYNLIDMIERADIEIVVAELNGKPIASGYARIEKAKHYFQHEKFAYLGFMYVVREHRGKGVNKKIIEYLKDWAKTQGLNELKLEVYVENIPAIKAYEKIGFAKKVIEMRMKIQ